MRAALGVTGQADQALEVGRLAVTAVARLALLMLGGLLVKAGQGRHGVTGSARGG